MEFLIVTQKPGESPGLMEVYGFYDFEPDIAKAVRVLKRKHVPFGVYRLYEPENGFPVMNCDHPWHRNPGLITDCPECEARKAAKGE